VQECTHLANGRRDEFIERIKGIPKFLFLDPKFLPSIFFAATIWCAMMAGRLLLGERRKSRIMRAGLAAGYPQKEINDYFSKK
jgi:hypothetical protein